MQQLGGELEGAQSQSTPRSTALEHQEQNFKKGQILLIIAENSSKNIYLTKPQINPNCIFFSTGFLSCKIKLFKDNPQINYLTNKPYNVQPTLVHQSYIFFWVTKLKQSFLGVYEGQQQSMIRKTEESL